MSHRPLHLSAPPGVFRNLLLFWQRFHGDFLQHFLQHFCTEIFHRRGPESPHQSPPFHRVSSGFIGSDGVCRQWPAISQHVLPARLLPARLLPVRRNQPVADVIAEPASTRQAQTGEEVRGPQATCATLVTLAATQRRPCAPPWPWLLVPQNPMPQSLCASLTCASLTQARTCSNAPKHVPVPPRPVQP